MLRGTLTNKIKGTSKDAPNTRVGTVLSPNLVDHLLAPRLCNHGSTIRKLALVAPRLAHIPAFSNRVANTHRCRDMIRKVQTLRGGVYLHDGAITANHLRDGRHDVDLDWRSWHILIQDEHSQVLGCARYTPFSSARKFSDLTVSKSSLAQCPKWGSKLEAAVESEMDLARRKNVPYVELGGWALADSIRGTGEALRMVLAIYGLAQVLGGVVGITTATKRHSSASILRRIGGFSLENGGLELPPYFDDQYSCEMEVLRFHSWAPNPRYLQGIERIKGQLRTMPVLTFDRCKTISTPSLPAHRNSTNLAHLNLRIRTFDEAHGN